MSLQTKLSSLLLQGFIFSKSFFILGVWIAYYISGHNQNNITLQEVISEGYHRTICCEVKGII